MVITASQPPRCGQELVLLLRVWPGAEAALTCQGQPGWGGVGKGKMGLKGFWRSAPNRCLKLLPPLDLSRR